MSIDFDSAALQTQHEEEEYDQEDYAREQELHKLLTDLPDDMLEDSRDSSPELEYSTCSNNNRNGQQPAWTQQPEWSDQPKLNSYEKNYENDYDQGSDHQKSYAYEDGEAHINGYGRHPQRQPLGPSWNPRPQANDGLEYDMEGEGHLQVYDDQNHLKKHFQNFDASGAGEGRLAQYKPNYNPHQLTRHPNTHNVQDPRQEECLDHLQREYLDTAHDTVDSQQLAQLQILKKAQQRQIEDLERKLEDSRRNMRYLEHQFAIVKDEKEGLGVSLKESSRLLEEAKEMEIQMQNKVKSLEQQVQSLTERDHENLKKQRAAEAALDVMKQQMTELCHSETLSRTRQQHDRDLTVMREKHDAALLALQQKLDSGSHALKEQTEVGQRLREQLTHLEQRREEEQVDRATVVNTLSQRLEESQQQCAKLLQTGSVQEMSLIQMKLQQAQSAKALSENINKVLQEDLSDLKEQITLYESAVRHGVIELDQSEDGEKPLSESYVELGIKNANRKNVRVHSTVLGELSETKLPQDQLERQLRAELQRCLASLKGKRQKISQLQEGLLLAQSDVSQLQTQLHEAKLHSTVRASHLDVTAGPREDLTRLQQENQLLRDQIEALEKKNQSLGQSEERVRAANTELCTKMREMIHEIDQEKQEAAQRYERVQQQYRDDVVQRVRTELSVEHEAQMDLMSSQYQQQIQQIQRQLSEANDKMVAVQECYISVCREKDVLETTLSNGEKDALTREAEIKEEAVAALSNLQTQLEVQHQASIDQLKADWLTEREREIQQQVTSQVASATASWKEEQQQMVRTWAQRLEAQRLEARRETAERSSQTEGGPATSVTVTAEELDARLSAQKQRLQVEAEEAEARAVEEARRRLQTDLQERHLRDMATQVEAAVSRAYGRWLEDVTSLPEYKVNLQREKDKWEELQQDLLKQKVSQTLKGREEQLQERLAAEQAALLKAELAAARAAWNGDKEREISSVLARRELEQERLLQEQRRRHGQALQEREEEWRGQLVEKERAHRQQARKEFVTELEASLTELRSKPQRNSSTEQMKAEETGGSGVTSRTPEDSIAQIVQSTYSDLLYKAVHQARKDWKKLSEERVTRLLRDTQEQHKREISQMQNAASASPQEPRCGKQCAEALGNMQKKTQDLQRHLEKACRQLQHTVRDNKAAMQRLKEEQQRSSQKAEEVHRQELEEVKRATESCGGCDGKAKGLEEMKRQYLEAVDKIRGDMLRYLQESKERAAELIRAEVQRERQDTARRMRRYYMSCLQKLLEHGEQTSGAEKKIMSAAGKLLAMAKVLETPIKKPSGRSHALPGSVTAANTPARREGSTWKSLTPEGDAFPQLDPQTHIMARKEKLGKALVQDGAPPSLTPEASGLNTLLTTTTYLTSTKARQAGPLTRSLSRGSRESYLQGADLGKVGPPVDPERVVIHETPVRDESDWSVASSGSDSGGAVAALSQSARRQEFTLDLSDVTVYNDIAKGQLSLPSGKRSTFRGPTFRGPTPGSEVTKAALRQQQVGPKTLFSVVRQGQQDSGFDSPFS